METQTDRSEEVAALWERYRTTGDRSARDRIVLTYVPLVRHIAYRKARSCRPGARSRT